MKKKQIIVAPSILGLEEDELLLDIPNIVKGGAKWLHIDIMDGKFVNHTSGSLEQFKKIAKWHDLVNDVHIMVEDPKSYVKEYIEAGADYLTFHYEACLDDDEVKEIIDLIHSYGAKAGLSIRPDTAVEKVIPFLKDIDLLLVMTVVPGQGGQSFMAENLIKAGMVYGVREMAKMGLNSEVNPDLLIEVDGGINEETAKQAVNCGVDVLVAGTYIFSGNVEERIKKLLN